MASTPRPLPFSAGDLLAKASTLGKDKGEGGPALFFELVKDVDQVAFYPKGEARGININDPRIVDSTFLSFKHWNRYELAKSLQDFIVTNGKVPPSNALTPLDAGEFPRIGQRGGMRIDWMLREFLERAAPPLPTRAGTLTVHRGSAILFLEGELGHAFTGVVKLPRAEEAVRYVRPKIFLISIEPSLKTPTEPYAVLSHGVKGASVIYGKKFEPIVHQGTGGGLAAHTQLSQAVASKAKYGALKQDAGDFIGFTVIKGALTERISNRYSFTSASSNAGSFPVRIDKKHTNCPTEEWGKEIKLACDELLKLDAHPVRREVVLTNKEGWPAVRDMYWPCGTPPVRVAEQRAETEETWET